QHFNFVPRGTQIEVRLDTPVTVAKMDRGRIYSAHVSRDVFARDGDLAVPRGAHAEMIVRQVGPNQLALDLESINVEGRRYAMDASGPQFNMNHNEYNSGAGLLGDIIGAISGGNVEYQGDRINVPAGSEITFQLRQPLRVVDWNDEGYENNGYHYHYERN